MRSFTDTFIKHPVLAVVVNLVIVLVGWRAITTLPVQQYPNIQSSSVLITTVYYGASAETVRGFLTTPIERAVSAISGVDYVESTSRAGVSSITVHLKLNHNSTAALAEVTARLQQVRSELPAEADLVQVNLLANTDLRTTEEFKNLVVAERNGAIVRLSDVARVELGAEEADFITKFSDKEAVYMGVWPLPGSNEIEVATRLHAEMARIRPTLPGDIDMQMAYDATVFMTDALQEISKTLVETILIVGLVVFLFMGSIRTALVPLVAMPVSLVGAPIGFQGGLTGSLFLEFANTLAAAVVVSGLVAVTLSPVMSSRFVHEAGREGRLTKLVHHAFEAVRRRYERLLDGALQMRWAIVAAAVLVMLAAVPLYQNSRRELAPIEDQSHISLFMAASPDASLEATNKASLQVVKAVTSFPEAKFMWSLTANWGGFGGMVAKNWKERKRTTEQMYGQLYYAVSQVPGLQVFPRLDPPLPTPGQYDVELILASDVPPDQMLQTVGAVLGAGWQSGKFLYVDTDLKIDLPEARVVIDRDQVADLGLDLASVGRELGTLLGGAYVNRFN